MRYTLRPASDADYDFLYELHAATIRPAVEATWGWDEAVQQDMFRQRWRPAHNQIVVAGDADAGVLRLEEGEEEIFIALIEIAPAWQNRGLGTAVLEDVIAAAGRRQLPTTLHVLKANRAARRLYERLGFAIIEERTERYVMRRE